MSNNTDLEASMTTFEELANLWRFSLRPRGCQGVADITEVKFKFELSDLSKYEFCCGCCFNSLSIYIVVILEAVQSISALE